MFRQDDRQFILAVCLIFAIGLILRAYGLKGQPLSRDDVMVGVSAVNYVNTGHLGPTMWNHPNLRNLLVYLSLWSSGGGVWGLKAVSFALGAFSVPLLALTAMRILKSREAACLAAFFLAVDPIHIDFSRQAVQEVYMMFFTLLGIYLAFKAEDGLRSFPLVLSGLFFGLGIASKWYVAFPLLVTYIYMIYRMLSSDFSKGEKKISGAALLSSTLIILPLTVYLLSFIPWFLRGFSIGDWLTLHGAMLRETRFHTGYNLYDLELNTKAILWFLKPAAYTDFAISGKEPTPLIGIANPLVWLLTLPAVIYIAYKGIKGRAGNLLFVAGLFWFTYAPFAITKRPIWAHTAFSVLPFAFMSVSYGIFDALKGLRHGKAFLAAYILLIVLSSIPLYLLATGHGLDIKWLRPITMMYRPSFER